MWRKGFTLIELIVVIAIIAILAAIIAPNAFKAIEKSKTSATIGELQGIKTASLSYFVDTGAFPPSCDGAATCSAVHDTKAGFIIDSTAATTGWDGPYLQKWPASTKFGGNYSWTSSLVSAPTSKFGGNNAERYITAAGPTLNVNVQNSIDKSIDGGTAPSLTTGELRSSVDNTVDFLVSRDGPISP